MAAGADNRPPVFVPVLVRCNCAHNFGRDVLANIVGGLLLWLVFFRKG